jgi:hypothetical protein
MIPRRTFEVVGLFNAGYKVAGDIEFYNRVSERFPVLRDWEVLHEVRSHRRMTQARSTAGPLYLREEMMLEGWYRSRWSPKDYRQIKRFRAASRGSYHLGWIKRIALAGRLAEAAGALWRLGRVYPLHWVVWWRIVALVRLGPQPQPTVPAPKPQR